MAAKNLDEAIKKSMTIGPAKDFPVTLKNEIRDLMAHEVMKVLGTQPTENETKLLYTFFKKVIGE
jgi:hypothetical protein